MKALDYATLLAKRMCNLNDEEMTDISWVPHAFDYFDKEEIMKRLELLTP